MHIQKLSLLIFLSLFLASFNAKNENFVGKITYKYSFTDLEGNDITEKLVPYLGREQHYFIDGANYKSYDQNNAWTQLYNSSTNSYFSFGKDGTAKKIEGATRTSQRYKVTKLDKKEKIAGYDCESIQVDTDNTTTIYYFNRSIKTDAKKIAKHNLGNWNTYLEATGGALSLKFVSIDRNNGYIWTCTAYEVVKQEFNPTDFTFPKHFTLKE